MTAVLNLDILGPSNGDADLTRAAVAGDKRAFAMIYDRYSDRLHDFCVGMLADRDSAADCVQDVFCTMATQLPRLRDPNKLRPWLYSIARNEALRRIRDRRRETPTDDMPDAASGEAGPETLAARLELSDLISDAAGGLSDRDRAVLELAFRHGLSGPDLADILGVTPANANTIVHRLRQNIERSLGALLVSRRVRNNGGCADLSAILDGWDGDFNVLMRKRISRHIESCDTCEEERRRLASPAALLGAAPVFIPAPAWLRERTLHEVQLTSSSAPMPEASAATDIDAVRDTRSSALPVAAFVIAFIAALSAMVVWATSQKTTVSLPIESGVTAPAPSLPMSHTPPPTAPVAPVITTAPEPSEPRATATPSRVAQPTTVAPSPVSEVPPPPSAPPSLLPPWPQFPELPQWPQLPPLPTDPGGDPGQPGPGNQFTGPSDLGITPPVAPPPPL